MSKADYAEMRFEDALVEEDDFDLLVMGRTQGKGCYCYVNGLLQAQLAKYQNHYPYIVVDNEAGMEHISRGVLPSMQTAILVSDCSQQRNPGCRKDREADRRMQYETEHSGTDRQPGTEGRTERGNQGGDRRTRDFIFWVWYLRMMPSMNMTVRVNLQQALPEDNPVKKALREIAGKLDL